MNLRVPERFTVKADTSASPASWIKAMWWICRNLKKISPSPAKTQFLSYMCFSATQLPCWRLDPGLIGTCPRSHLSLSYGCVPDVVHSLSLYWQDTRASSFLFSFFCLSLPLCQRVFHQCMRWCTTEWGHRRWSGNLLTAPCSPPSTTQAPDLLSCRLWTQKQLVKRCCVCAHVCSLYLSLLCYMWCNCG